MVEVLSRQTSIVNMMLSCFTRRRSWSFGSRLRLRGSERCRSLTFLLSRLDEAPDKRECRVSDFSPAAVNRKRVPAVGDLNDLGHANISLLALERRVRYGPRDCIVLLTRNDQQRPPIGVFAVDLRLCPRVEFGGRGLEQRN